jgi:hypothetical protein
VGVNSQPCCHRYAPTTRADSPVGSGADGNANELGAPPGWERSAGRRWSVRRERGPRGVPPSASPRQRSASALGACSAAVNGTVPSIFLLYRPVSITLRPDRRCTKRRFKAVVNRCEPRRDVPSVMLRCVRLARTAASSLSIVGNRVNGHEVIIMKEAPAPPKRCSSLAGHRPELYPARCLLYPSVTADDDH